jgi:gluconate kinase
MTVTETRMDRDRYTEFMTLPLGGLQSAELNRQAFTSSIAEELQCAFEDAEPHVSARLECLKPKPDLTDEDRAAAKARFQRRLKEMTSASKS